MEKHHVKNGHTHPENGHSQNLGPDPSNDEYIPVLKKVSLDSLVEFSPHELNSCRDGGKFWPCVGREKEEKEKEKKERKRKKKEDFSWVFVDQSNAFLSVISWTYSTILRVNWE